MVTPAESLDLSLAAVEAGGAVQVAHPVAVAGARRSVRVARRSLYEILAEGSPEEDA